VSENAAWLTAREIVDQLHAKRGNSLTNWVVLSGGNPLLWELGLLVHILHEAGWRVAVETQGTIWRPWLGHVDQIVISPKPPSSRMKYEHEKLTSILSALLTLRQDHRELFPQVALKVVVFGRTDFEFARGVHDDFPGWPFYISIGNDNLVYHEPMSVDDIAHKVLLLVRLAEVTEWCLADRQMSDVVVLPQLHVLMWGNKRGV
jgi:7-carboxy-7-deazaguanine synthase